MRQSARLCLIAVVLSVCAVSSTAQTVTPFTNNVVIYTGQIVPQPSTVLSVTIQPLQSFSFGGKFFPADKAIASLITQPQLTNGSVYFTNLICGVPSTLTVVTIYDKYVTNLTIAPPMLVYDASSNIIGGYCIGSYVPGIGMFYANQVAGSATATNLSGNAFNQVSNIANGTMAAFGNSTPVTMTNSANNFTGQFTDQTGAPLLAANFANVSPTATNFTFAGVVCPSILFVTNTTIADGVYVAHYLTNGNLDQWLCISGSGAAGGKYSDITYESPPGLWVIEQNDSGGNGTTGGSYPTTVPPQSSTWNSPNSWIGTWPPIITVPSGGYITNNTTGTAGGLSGSPSITIATVSDATGQFPSAKALAGALTPTNIYSKTLWVDVSGNNSSAKPYRTDLPYATPDVAALYASPGDTIHVRSGTYILTNSVVLNPFVNLIGDGIGITVITNSTQVGVLTLTQSNIVERVSLTGYTGIVQGTNCFWRDVLIAATTDNASTGTFCVNTFYNCQFEIGWDGIKGGTNYYFNCTANKRSNYSYSSCILFTGAIVWSGGAINVYTNAPGSVMAFVNGNLGTNYQSVVVQNCAINFYNGVAGLAFFQTGNAPMTVGGCEYDPNQVSGTLTPSPSAPLSYFVVTNGVPAISAPPGAICTTTNGQFFVRSNTVWMLK